MRTAWIAGASGLTGSHCLQHLLASREYSNVIALSRRPLPVTHAKLRLADMQASHAPAPDDVFCAIGTTIRKAGSREAFRAVDHDLPLRIARLAPGARRFVLISSVDADPASANFYLRVKGETEAALEGFESIHIFRPSFLIGERTERRLLERASLLAAGAMQWALAGRLRKYRSIEADTLARAMVAAAIEGSPGRYIHHYDEIIRLASRGRAIA